MTVAPVSTRASNNDADPNTEWLTNQRPTAKGQQPTAKLQRSTLNSQQSTVNGRQSTLKTNCHSVSGKETVPFEYDHSPHVDSFEHVASPARPMPSIPTIALACCVHKSLPAPPEDVCPLVVLAWNIALAEAMELWVPAAFAVAVDFSSNRRRKDLFCSHTSSHPRGIEMMGLTAREKQGHRRRYCRDTRSEREREREIDCEGKVHGWTLGRTARRTTTRRAHKMQPRCSSVSNTQVISAISPCI